MSIKRKTDRFSCVKCGSKKLMIAQEAVMYTMVSSMKPVTDVPHGKRWLECASCSSKQKYPFDRD